MHEYYQVWFSAEDKEQATDILHKLVAEHLLVGGTILHGPTRFWWKGDLVDMDYHYVMGFTTANKRAEIEAAYATVSKEEIPMVSFIKMEGNAAFLNFIAANTN